MKMMQFRRAHFFLKLRLHEHFAEQFIRAINPVGVRNHHVVNADEIVVAQIGVVKFETAGVTG